MKNLFILFITLVILSSCSNKDNLKDRRSPIDETRTENNNIHQEDLDGIFTTPEDSLSIEQKELRQKVLYLMKENIKLKDDRFYSTATKEDFESIGISESYYYMLQENLDEMNAMIKEDSLDAKKLYEEMMKDFSDK